MERMAARILLVAALGAAAAACGAPASDARRAAITNGADDAGDPAVVALVSLDGQVECSGTLIAPHVVLTAAHCGIDGSNFDQFLVSFGATASATGALALADALPHPMFDPSTLADDVALLTLRQAAPADPIAVDARPVDATWIGQTFSAVGFGATAATASDEGQKRSGTAKVTAVDADSFTAMAAPSQPCGGDSGGPALFSDGTTTFVSGVTSHGDTACVDHAVFARLDVQAAGFIQPYLDALAPASLATGARCFFDEQCQKGPCLQAADEPKRSFCSQACGSCPAPLTCVSGQCRYRAPSPGALGAACAQPSDCASGLCTAGACTRSCVPTSATACPSGYECKNTSDISFECVAVKRAGCDVAASGGAGGGLWLLALAAIARLLRRRRQISEVARWTHGAGFGAPGSPNV